MTVYTALKAVTEIVDPIVKAAEGRIGTHSATCYEYHVHCLAALIAERIEEEMKS